MTLEMLMKNDRINRGAYNFRWVQGAVQGMSLERYVKRWKGHGKVRLEFRKCGYSMEMYDCNFCK